MIRKTKIKKMGIAVALLLTFCLAGVSVGATDFQKLLGRWQRTDGGYILEIRHIDTDGKTDAGYYNPNSIHVSQARASLFKGYLKIEVVLRDVRYPGSKYTLLYVPDKDILSGIYDHAPSGQKFNVVFVRLKTPPQ